MLSMEDVIDSQQCECCHGKGWWWKPETINHGKEIGVEYTELKTTCEECDSLGWIGEDALIITRAHLTEKEKITKRQKLYSLRSRLYLEYVDSQDGAPFVLDFGTWADRSYVWITEEIKLLDYELSLDY